MTNDVPTPAAAQRRQRSGARVAVPVTVVVGVLTLLLVGTWAGAFGGQGLVDLGAGVRWSAPVVTVLAHLAAALTVGSLLLVATVLPGPASSPAARSALVVASMSAAAWALLAGARVVLGYANVVGVPPSDPSFGEQLGFFVTQVSLGRLLLTVALLAAVASTLALTVTRARGAVGVLLVVGLALAVLAETGHATGAAGHETATTAMTLHLAGATAWVGGLGALVLLARQIGSDLPLAAARFSVIALWAFLAVAVSGGASAWIRLGGLEGFQTTYGRLVLAKGALLLLLGTAGYLHRRATLPRLAADRATAGATVAHTFWRLAGVELAVMGATTGVAVTLAGSAPPVPDVAPAAPTPVEAITGYPAPPAPDGAAWVTLWRLDLLFALAAVVMLVVYLRWAARLHRRGDAWPIGRTVSWIVGAAVLVWATNGAPAVYGTVLFSAHMLEHMVLAMVVPLLLCLAAPVTLALRALPARRDGSRGPREWLLALVESRWARFFATPLVAAVAFAGSMIVFYMTAWFPWSLASHPGHVLMVVHFTLVGYLFVNALVGADPGPRRPGYPVRLLLLFATMAFHAFFGVALAQSTVLLAADRFGALGLPWGVDALADQQQGAYLAWAVGELPTLALAVLVAVRWAREDDRTARRSDRAADRDGDADLAAYNAMLARLAAVTPSGSRDRGPNPGP